MSLDSDEFQESTSEGFLGQKFQVPDFGVLRKSQSFSRTARERYVWSIEEIQQQSKHFFNMQQCRFRKYGSTKCND